MGAHGGAGIIVVGVKDKEENVENPFLAAFNLHQNYPNPFNPSTTIVYQLPKPGSVKLTIFNVLGSQVRQLVNNQQTAGRYTVQWDGNDALGKKAASGIYFYRLQADQFTETKKMFLLR